MNSIPSSMTCRNGACFALVVCLCAPHTLRAQPSQPDWLAAEVPPPYQLGDVGAALSDEEYLGTQAALQQLPELLPDGISQPSGGGGGHGFPGDRQQPAAPRQAQPGEECTSWPGDWGADWLGCLRGRSASGRHIGKGQPLMGTSWLNRPYHAGWFVGILFGDELMDSRVDQGNDFFGGYRLGWDMDHYWGSELRMGWAAVPLSDDQGAPQTRTADVFLADISVLYYPWGDARWRPYFLVGLGMDNFDFFDDRGFRRDTTLFGLPFGAGIKYLFRQWLAFRAELLDNVAFADSGIDSMNNVSLTVGVEVHFGAARRSYWPWNLGRHDW